MAALKVIVRQQLTIKAGKFQKQVLTDVLAKLTKTIFQNPPQILWCGSLPVKLQDLLICNSTKDETFSEDFLKITF